MNYHTQVKNIKRLLQLTYGKIFFTRGIALVIPKGLSALQGVFLVKSRGRKRPSNIMVVICTPAVWYYEAYTIDDIIYF